MTTRLTRSVKLLDYKENDGGLLRVITELDSGLSIGDYVFIVGTSNLDNYTTSSVDSFDPYGTSIPGYKIVAANTSKNLLTLDVAYNPSTTIGSNAYISRTYISSGDLTYGTLYDGVLGKKDAPDKIKIGPKSVSSFTVNNIPTVIWSCIAMGCNLHSGRWGTWIGPGATPSISTVKYMLQSGVPVQIGVSTNNDGLGYSFFLSGTFGVIPYVSQPYSRMAMGTMLGGSWIGGLLTGGLLWSDANKIVVSGGSFTGGETRQVIWENANISGGTHSGAYNIDVLDVIEDTTKIKIYLSGTDITKFEDGDYVSLMYPFSSPASVSVSSSGTNTNLNGYSHVSSYVTSSDIFSDSMTDTHYVQIDKPSWYTNPGPLIDGTFVTYSASDALNVSAGTFVNFVFGTSNSSISDLTCTNFFSSGCIFNTGVYGNFGINTSGSYQSRIHTGTYYNGIIKSTNIMYARLVNMTLLASNMYSGVFRSGSTTDSNFFGVDASSGRECVFVSGNFANSFKDATVRWDTVNYISGTFTGYSGGVGFATNPNIYYTDYYPTAIPGLIYGITPNSSGTYTFSVVPSRTGSVYIDVLENEAVAVELITDAGSILYQEWLISDSNLETVVGNANTVVSGGGGNPVQIYNITRTGIVSTVASGLARVRYRKYNYTPVNPSSYTVTAALHDVSSPGTFYPPGTVALGAPSSLEAAINITALPGGTTQWPDDAISVTAVTVDVTASPTASYPNPPGSAQAIPNLGGGSPVPYTGTTNVILINTSTSTNIAISAMPGDTVTINMTYRFRLTSTGLYSSPIVTGPIHFNIT